MGLVRDLERGGRSCVPTTPCPSCPATPNFQSSFLGNQTIDPASPPAAVQDWMHRLHSVVSMELAEAMCGARTVRTAAHVGRPRAAPGGEVGRHVRRGNDVTLQPYLGRSCTCTGRICTGPLHARPPLGRRPGSLSLSLSSQSSPRCVSP